MAGERPPHKGGPIVERGSQSGSRSEEGVLGAQSRRDFLRKAGGGAALLGVGGLLAACGGSAGSTTTSSTGAPAGRPKRGGTITLASTGGGSADTLDGDNCVTNLDFARAPQLYDTLMEVDANNVPQLHLADEVTPNSGATEWTIRVKKGVVFHNGKPLTIDDVIYTFNRIITNKYSAASGLASFDMKNAKKLDQYTVRIPMLAAYSIMPITLIGNGEMSIVPEGYDPKKPVGTGPFKLESFTPGSQSVFTRNADYFVSGEPYVDKLVIVDYSDESSQVNALQSGQATCIDQLSIASVATLKNGGQVANVWGGPGWVPFTMRLDVAPFNDVNVRQAMRLVVDRPQMREEVYGGYGFLGNDVFSITDPEYDTALPQRHQDIAQAKFLLKKAGQENLTTTLVTGPIKTGATEMAQVLKQQAAAAGITINLNQITSGEFFGPNYLKWTFAQDWWSGYPYLRQAGYSMVPGAPWDETHWDTSPYGSKYLSIYKQALATVDESSQANLVHEMMTMDYNEGGYIIPAFNPIIVGQSPSLKGVVTQKNGDPWIEWRFRQMWLA
jgi:peptide/nickel transport system substrate-binding protein